MLVFSQLKNTLDIFFCQQYYIFFYIRKIEKSSPFVERTASYQAFAQQNFFVENIFLFDRFFDRF
ncbi:hypothetical protein D922_03454 [Enterococcus faecalis 06-MB-DW-09]|nr:hypothetical protein D922_03454 [Enterococcus faecalis 06-MB-DW-09]